MSRPTANQKRMWNKMAALGCCACLVDGIEDTPAEIHHIKNHGNHHAWHVIPLCPAHHRPTAGVKGVPSIHGQPKEFARRYGATEELYNKCMQLIAG